MTTTYLLDANVFITAKNLHYGFSFCAAFWDWVTVANQIGTVFSIERVYDELVGEGDDVSEWASQRRGLFLDPGVADVQAIAVVNRWANDSPEYEPAAKAQFAQVADSFLVGQALAGHHTVVTHEVPSDSRRRIKIPNATAAMGVPWCTPFQMLRASGARFELGRDA